MSTINRSISLPLQTALQAFMAKIAPLNQFARNFSPDPATRGSAIQVPLISGLTATTFASSYTGTGGTLNTVTVNVTKHRIATIDVTDVQMMNQDILIDNFAPQLGNALAKLVLQDIWGIVLTTNYAEAVVTTASANWTKTQLRTMRLALASDNVDTSQCTLVCNEDIFDALLADTSISYAMYYGGPEAIREAKIPRLLGCSILPTNLLPSNAITLQAFLAHPDAIATAFRSLAPVVPDGAYEAFEQATDPSGISLTSRLLYEPETGKRFWSAECLFGVSAGVTNGLEIAVGKNS